MAGKGHREKSKGLWARTGMGNQILGGSGDGKCVENEKIGFGVHPDRNPMEKQLLSGSWDRS